MAQDGTRWYKVVKVVHKLVHGGTTWYEVIQGGTRWYKVV